jgi:transposase
VDNTVVSTHRLRIYLTTIELSDLILLPDILEYCSFSHRTFDCIHAHWVRTGDVVKDTFGIQGRPRILQSDDVDYLLRLVRQRLPDWFLNELLNLLKTNRFISVHYATIHRTLTRAGASLKKIAQSVMEMPEMPSLTEWQFMSLRNLVIWMKF